VNATDSILLALTSSLGYIRRIASITSLYRSF